MKYSVKASKYSKEGSAVKGIVTIIFNDSVIVKRIKLVEVNGKTFLSMPSRTYTNKKTGEKKYYDLFNPIDKDLSAELTDAAIKSFENDGEIQVGYTDSGEDMPIRIGVRNVDLSTNIKSMVHIILDNKFIIKNIRYYKKDNTAFLIMPSSRNRNPEDRTKYYYYSRVIDNKLADDFVELTEKEASR